MKFSEAWLREWVRPSLSREDLCDGLTMVGLEIESLSPVALPFSGVVIGQVLNVQKHPEADRLRICEVDVGLKKPLTIVCGASNVRPEMKVAAALEGAVLSDKTQIKISKLRGVISEGMLCSARELGLAEESEGLFELPQNAPIAANVFDYLKLADYVIDVSITPNRGDCLSLLGMATEVAALTKSPLTKPKLQETPAKIKDVLPVKIHAEAACPRYVGRMIRGVKADAITPIELQEKLRRSGIRSISPIVDVTNYVMLELGQPMHAFSLDKIVGGIDVRLSQANESLRLLDGSEVKLDAETLVIADQKKPLAIAGVMGGLDSGVTLLTQDIFLESAFFHPTDIARAGRRYKLGSDSSYRFERGVDPTIQRMAIERATELLLSIVGGQPGPVIETCSEKHLPSVVTIELRAARVLKILGVKIPDAKIEEILESLGFVLKKQGETWQVTVPLRRSDISLEIDLIEEIARFYGYNLIPESNAHTLMQVLPRPENRVNESSLRRVLCDLGYQEVITYSFIDKKMQTLFAPEQVSPELLNPITAEMSVMRSSLWPGLITTLLYNQNRQQSRVRLFETGLCFTQQGAELLQGKTLSGLANGAAMPAQWGLSSRPVDFFDLKGDLQNLFKLTLSSQEFTFRAGSSAALHPGQSADIYRNEALCGVMGAIHPSIIQALKIEGPVFVFELKLNLLEMAKIPQAMTLSKFPEIRRDIAIVLDQTVPAVAIQDTIIDVAGEWLKKVDIFDIYQGKGIEKGRKSVALALTLQHSSRTLVDEEVIDLMERIITTLKGRYNAELRG